MSDKPMDQIIAEVEQMVRAQQDAIFESYREAMRRALQIPDWRLAEIRQEFNIKPPKPARPSPVVKESLTTEGPPHGR